MAFSIDQTVIHIKLTDTGRELLSRGELRFTQFAIGDSEIDYSFNNETGIDSFNAATFRPVDRNPDIATFVTRTVSGETLNTLPSVVSTTSTITNTAPQRGLFDVTGGTTQIYNDPIHVKQADVQIPLSNVVGGNNLILNQGPFYGANPTEPQVGDYVMVKWANPFSTGSTTSFNVDNAIPYIFYKIVNIVSGALNTNDLLVEVDRDLPDFTGYAGGLTAGALIYPNNNGRFVSGDSVQNYYGVPFATGFLDSFFENYIPKGNTVEVWNMTIVYTKDVIGIDPATYRGFGDNPSRFFGGLIQYLQRIAPTVENIGIIHYTNASPFNDYGEGLVASNSTVPTLDLPTVMSHLNTGGTMGMTLTADFASKDDLPDLNTEYYNLVDEFGNILGKAFTDLKIFIIEDSELLHAMSYKANRNWTLPQASADFNASLCPDGDVMIDNVMVINP